MSAANKEKDPKEAQDRAKDEASSFEFQNKFVKRAAKLDEHDSRYLYLEDRPFNVTRRLESGVWYNTNQTNQRYVKYHDFRYTAFKRMRCMYHLDDVFNSIDGKASVWGCLVQFLKCMQSDPGQEPERLRDEYWP